MSTSTTSAQPTATSINPMRAYSKWQQKYYPLELWWALGCFIALISLFYLFSLVMAYHTKLSARRSSKRSDEDVEKKGCVRPDAQPSGDVLPRALRNIPSAALSGVQMFLFRIRLPLHRLHRMNVAEATITIGYLTALLVWGFINSRGLTVGLWANRAAHLATSQTPLIVALAGKNNIIGLLTGISYEKLNVLHRASARSTLLLIWVHAFGRWKLGLHGHFSLDEVDMRFGVVSMAAFTLAVILSIRPIRNLAYEAFLISHIILVAMYLIFGMFHVPDVKYRFWPALAIWALDRSLRGLRMVVLNKLWVNILPLRKKVDEASLECLSGDTVRITVRRSFKWRSGQHAYIFAPKVAKLPFEGHPFTIASIYSERTQEDCGLQELVFIIRSRDGFTKKLLEASETRRSIPVIIDGPGVSYTIPLLLDLVRQVKLGHAIAQRALFVWVIREPSHIYWVNSLLKEAIQDSPPTLRLSMNIYITQQFLPQLCHPNTTTGESTPTAVKQLLAENSRFPLMGPQVVNVLDGRPNVDLLLEEELGRTNGRVSINVSGPSTLADTARDALVACNSARPTAVLEGVPRTTLHVENFGW